MGVGRKSTLNTGFKKITNRGLVELPPRFRKIVVLPLFNLHESLRFGKGLENAYSLTIRNDFVIVPMHDKRRALDFLNMLIVGETVPWEKGNLSNGPERREKRRF